MKIEYNENGWSEITTVNIKIKGSKWNNFLDNMTTKEWLASNIKLKLKAKGRSRCDCCHIPWDKLDGKVNFYFTNKGNKVICDSCREKIGAK